MYAVKKTEHFTLLSRQVEKRSRFLSLNAPKLLTCPTKTQVIKIRHIPPSFSNDIGRRAKMIAARVLHPRLHALRSIHVHT